MSALKSFTGKVFSSFKLLVVLFSLLLTGNSCREQFSEQDALDILNKMDVVFYVYDKSSANEPPVEGAVLTVIQGEKEYVLTTDVNGIAVFKDLQLGTLIYRVTAGNYLQYSGEAQFYSEGGLISQQTLSIGLFNLNDESLATVKGRVLIETDLTNDDTEFAQGVVLNLRVQVDNQYLTFSESTDSEGKYEFRVPAERYGSYTVMRIPDLELPQRIAYNYIAGEGGPFPEVLPVSEFVQTVFSTNTSANRNFDTYPYQAVRPYYALAEASENPQGTAIISSVFTDGEGHIAGLNFAYGGDYYNDADGKVRVDVYSLGQGSGAWFEFYIDVEMSNLQDIYLYGSYTLEGGSGYPHEEYLYNRAYPRYPTPTTGDSREKYLGNIIPGSTTIINIDYGTGTYRLLDYD